MTTVQIDTPHGPVTGVIHGDRTDGDIGVLLAHGAGAGQHHPWMVAMGRELVDRGFTVMTFDYLYTATGRKAPDRLPKLLDVHEAAAATLAGRVDGVVVAGKSMGGRVGGHLVAEGRCDPVGIVYLGYPLVAMGKTEPRPTDHLTTVTVPQLFVSGERDRMGPTAAIEAVAASVPAGGAVIIESGDHSFVPLKSSGRTLEDNLASVADAIEGWVDSEVLGQAGGGR